MATLLDVLEAQAAAAEAQSSAFDAIVELYDAEVERRRDADHVAAKLAIEVASLRKTIGSLTVDDDGCCDGNGIAMVHGEPRACGERDCSRWATCSARVLEDMGLADEVSALRAASTGSAAR
jgi:hypothetical protein